MSDAPSENISSSGARISTAFVERVLKGGAVRTVEDLDDDTVKTIADSVVPGEYAALDDINFGRSGADGLGDG